MIERHVNPSDFIEIPQQQEPGTAYLANVPGNPQVRWAATGSAVIAVWLVCTRGYSRRIPANLPRKPKGGIPL